MSTSSGGAAQVVRVPLEKACLCNATTREPVSDLTVTSDPQRWSYAIAIAMAMPPSTHGDDSATVISVRVTVHEGTLGMLLVTEDQQQVSTQDSAGPGHGQVALSVVAPGMAKPLTLIFRNETSGDRPCRFTVHGVEMRREPEVQAAALSSVLTTDARHVDVRALSAAARASLATADGHLLDVVPVRELHVRLRLREPLDYPISSEKKPFELWNMDVDDAPILRYIYRGVNPARHLEFGTWQGQGACYCLEESAATVWTINLPFGERFENGDPAYYATLPPEHAPQGAEPLEEGGATFQTDAGQFIGRLYREKQLGHRVCQIYCDSREWDISNYPRGFFDTVLIDGGHTEEIVVSDTRRAFELVRPGGVVLWHDFCPAPNVLRSSRAAAGVITAIVRHFSAIRRQCADLFWIRPSFLLLGVRGDDQRE